LGGEGGQSSDKMERISEMMNQVTSTEAADSRWSWLYKIGGAAALIAGMLLLIGMISLIVSVLQRGTTNGWLSLFQNNWLIVIFKLHAEFSGIHADLHGLNLLDIVILTLVGIICLSLSNAFRKASKIWSLIAFALSLIAIMLFIATQIAGRSTVMLAVLIISFTMLRNKIFSKVTIYAGILASVFLFVGDLSVGIRSNIITVLFGVGYVLLITWFFLIAQSLFRLGSGVLKAQVQ
jgi:hypothetical protein